MMIAGRRIAAAVLLVAVWVGAAAAQGLYWESNTTGVGKEARTSQTYAMPKMMKTVSSAGQTVILRGDQDKFLLVDPKKQTYREMSFTEMESAAKNMQGQMDAARAQLEARMKDMPPEQRAMMEKMLPKIPAAGAAKPAAIEVKNTGETKTIGGYSCTKYVASDAGKTVLVAWTTKDLKGFEGLRNDWLSFQKRMGNTNRAFGSSVSDAYAKIEGFPMETEMGEIKMTVTKVEARTTPATEFEVPAGYKKEVVELPKAPPHP